MSTNTPSITPSGLAAALLIIAILAALAIPRFREASIIEKNAADPPKILATFGADVSAMAEVVGAAGVAVSCGSCGDVGLSPHK